MITSAQNQKIQLVRRLTAKRKEREAAGSYIAEGIRLVEEALKYASDCEFLLWSAPLSPRAEALVKGFADAGASVEEIDPRLMDSIAGTGTEWKDGQTRLDYDGISLETGPLSPDGLSPADALPVILSACQSGAILESGWTSWGETEHCLYLLIQNPNTASQESKVALWADPETGSLLQAEILWEEHRVISFSFTEFILETAPQETAD